MKPRAGKDVVIYGASALGRVVLDILRQSNARVVAFLDSDPQKHHKSIDGLPVLGGAEMVAALVSRGATRMVVAIGDSLARVRVARRLRAAGAELISAIHPLASISPSAVLARHIVIGARAIVCVHARIGAHAVISTGAIVEHDNLVGRGAFLHPAVRLAGGVSIGAFVTLGIGACVIPGRRVGRGAHVAPGAVVIRDVANRQRVGGAPARPTDHAIGERRTELADNAAR